MITKVAAAHKISNAEIMLAYVHQKDISVLTSFDTNHLDWAKEDLNIFEQTLSAAEVAALDGVQRGKRTCTDCYTVECQACGKAMAALGCPVGPFPLAGRSNPQAQACMACAAAAANTAAVAAACSPGRGETVETLVPKACGE